MGVITTSHTILTTLLTGTLAVGLTACVGPGDEFEDQELRHIHFDSDELAAALADDPDTVFFADLRVGNVLHFERGEAPFAFDRFLVQCPSMPAPVPMPTMIEEFDLELDEREAWEMYSVETEYDRDPDGFRAISACTEVCDKNGSDCILVC